MSILTDKHWEELAHPHLFPTGKLGYQVDREVPLSPIKYFNQRLLNYKQKFSSDPDYIFFANSVTQQLNLNSRVNTAMQKVKSTILDKSNGTPGHFSSFPPLPHNNVEKHNHSISLTSVPGKYTFCAL